MFGFQSADGKAVLQMSLTGGHFIVQMGGAYMQLSDTPNDPNTILTPGPFVLGTSGNTPAEHVATSESVVALFVELMRVIGPPLLGLEGPSLDGVMAGVVAAAATGGLVTTPGTAASILAAFNLPAQKPPAVGVQLKPGLGCTGFLVG